MKSKNPRAAKQPQIIPIYEWHTLLASGKHELLSFQLLNGLLQFRNKDYLTITREQRSEINFFVENFLYFFCHQRFKLPAADVPSYVNLNATIASVVACSDFVNTDAWLRMLETKQGSRTKILALYSLRNRHRPAIQTFFSEMPELASHWYAMQMLSSRPPAHRWLMDNARSLYAELPDSYVAISAPSINTGYFAITYLEPESERPYKQKLNAAIQKVCKTIHWNAPRNPRALAVITRRWFPESAVYRALHPYLKALAGDYELTLVHLGQLNPKIDGALFSEIRVFPPLDDVRKLSAQQRSAILDQDWTVAFFPDIGMDAESIYLGNCRLAPIQAMGYGHPASMHGGQIDYFISGVDSELPEFAEQYFSERLVLLPGMGMIPVWPTEPVDTPSKHDRGMVLVNCPWTLFKMNADIIELLREIIEECAVPMRFRFFAGLDQSDKGAKAGYWSDLAELLGEQHMELYGLMSYQKFLSDMATGDITIVPYPFGGFNTVIDSLYVGVPAVTQEGSHGYNRFPAALLRKVGMEELITDSREEFKAKIIQLITDTDYRLRLTASIAQTDLEKCIRADLDPGAFKRAVDYLVANHESLLQQDSRTPILIK